MCSSFLSVCGQDRVMHDFSNSRLFEFACRVPCQDSVLLDFSDSRHFKFQSTSSGRDSVFPDPSNLVFLVLLQVSSSPLIMSLLFLDSPIMFPFASQFHQN